MPVSSEDFVSISDFLGRYCWAVDEGQADEWAALWAEDGVFAGIGPEPIQGREALRQIPLSAGKPGGPMRHHYASLTCDYQDGTDTVLARYYNFVGRWDGSGKPGSMAMSRAVLIRNGDSWLMKRSDTTILQG